MSIIEYYRNFLLEEEKKEREKTTELKKEKEKEKEKVKPATQKLATQKPATQKPEPLPIKPVSSEPVYVTYDVSFISVPQNNTRQEVKTQAEIKPKEIKPPVERKKRPPPDSRTIDEPKNEFAPVGNPSEFKQVDYELVDGKKFTGQILIDEGRSFIRVKFSNEVKMIQKKSIKHMSIY